MAPVVEGKAARVGGRLRQWAPDDEPVRQERIEPLALSITAAAPGASVASLAATAQVSPWVFAIDDIFDDRLVPIELLRERCRHYVAQARGDLDEPSDPDDPMEVALAAVLLDLRPFSLFEPLRATWAAALARTLLGMLFEDAAQRRYAADENPDELPTYAAYLEPGLNSIGAPAHTAAVLLTSIDASVPHALSALARLGREVAISIRLANDLRSFDRERRDGAVNASLIHQHDLALAGVPQAAARRGSRHRVEEAIDAAMRRARGLARKVRTRSGDPEAAILGIGEVVTAFYRSYDHHTYTVQRAQA